MINEIKEIIDKDILNMNLDSDITIDCIHQAIRYKNYRTNREVNFNCNVATRYYEDEKYVRAYAFLPNECGVCIFSIKEDNCYTVFVLSEDDGAWFIPDDNLSSWIFSKSSFVSLISEALSIFNNNYNGEGSSK